VATNIIIHKQSPSRPLKLSTGSEVIHRKSTGYPQVFHRKPKENQGELSTGFPVVIHRIPTGIPQGEPKENLRGFV
jgi:hypothetical protein